MPRYSPSQGANVIRLTLLQIAATSILCLPWILSTQFQTPPSDTVAIAWIQVFPIQYIAWLVSQVLVPLQIRPFMRHWLAKDRIFVMAAVFASALAVSASAALQTWGTVLPLPCTLLCTLIGWVAQTLVFCFVCSQALRAIGYRDLNRSFSRRKANSNQTKPRE